MSSSNNLENKKTEAQTAHDKKMTEFMNLLGANEPLIPDQVVDHYLNKAGFECNDERLKRLFSLASQKFISDISNDAYQYARIRTSAGPGGRGRPTGTSKSKTVLTADDLTAALSDYGINARKPDYYI
ncbi:Transcription initiation factor TFIID subunit 10 [Wallemia ichthyophaga EXF-994]|uniref:Transcription initiation factor TFIID subunit 10 n=1 Tax=Wallemia ichthyophaga (strain EXF-994 / CBS 113033) TaxID=1299270 RepID=R9AH36_WALI9|nr:Transcription initiation factor TFIID subunit 10 [Wallemia ichthyophaga EXF-994]EOR01513.1 Transcription initiation factor TFIID subunit 10 [Wallemia ichthyophaga EXF-994]